MYRHSLWFIALLIVTSVVYIYRWGEVNIILFYSIILGSNVGWAGGGGGVQAGPGEALHHKGYVVEAATGIVLYNSPVPKVSASDPSPVFLYTQSYKLCFS